MDNTDKFSAITETTIRFRLAEVNTYYFQQNPPLKPFDQNNPSLIDYNLNFALPNKIEDNRVSIICKIEALIKETLERIGEIQTEFKFEIDSINDKPIKSSEKIGIPQDIITTFVSITISTMRGIMIEKFRGTLLQHQLLPVINPTVITQNLLADNNQTNK